MSSFETAYYASSVAVEVVTISAATMTNIIRSAPAVSSTTTTETNSNTLVPKVSTPLSATVIGLVGGLGGCGILGFIIWAVLYFRWFKPIEITTKQREAEDQDGAITRQNGSRNRNSQIVDVPPGVLFHNASGIATARPSTEGSVYPSVGIAVNTALEREILQILEAEVAAIGRCRGLGSGLV